MFQIETAMLDFQDQGMSGSQSDKTSVIKRFVFYLFPELFFVVTIQHFLACSTARSASGSDP